MGAFTRLHIKKRNTDLLNTIKAPQLPYGEQLGSSLRQIRALKWLQIRWCKGGVNRWLVILKSIDEDTDI